MLLLKQHFFALKAHFLLIFLNFLDSVGDVMAKALPALVILMIGFFISSWGEKSFRATWQRLRWPETLLRGFFASLIRWVILGATIVIAIEQMGVKSGSILTLLGAAGLAVGFALQNTLSNLSAGVMLLIFRPFHVGDQIETATLSGKIRSITLYHTELVTEDYIYVVVPNSMIWSGYLKNLSRFPSRHMIIKLSLPYAVHLPTVMEVAKAWVFADKRINPLKPPQIHILKFEEKVMELQITLWCLTQDCVQIRSDLLLAIWSSCLSDKIPLPSNKVEHDHTKYSQ